MYVLKLPKVIGHRGACGYAPENTLASMREAAKLGVDWVEFDVMLTKDNVPIVLHDTTLNRTTSGQGEVAKKTWQEIANLDAGSWFEKKFSDQRIPELSVLLDELIKLKLNINVEIKPTPGNESLTAEKMYDVLKSRWSIEKSMPLISSAKIQPLRTIYKLNPMLPLGFISDVWLDNLLPLAQELHCITLNINHKVLTPEKIQQAKKLNYWVLAYTVNDAERAKQLFSWGVDAVFSDFPDRIASNK